MPKREDERVAPRKNGPPTIDGEPLTVGSGNTSLRGPAVGSFGRRSWLVVGALGLAVFAVAVVVSFLSASNDNARIERMRNHGIPVAVTVTNCFGNVGGSGSNGAGYTCHGRYAVSKVNFDETIGSMSSFSSSGAVVRGVVDPSQHSYVILASAIDKSAASNSAYVDPGLLAIALLALSCALLYFARRSGSFPRASTERT